MWSISGSMFSENWGETPPYFDENGIFGGRSPKLRKLKNTPAGIISKIITAGNYMFQVNKRKTETRCEICSKLTIKTPEQRQ